MKHNNVLKYLAVFLLGVFAGLLCVGVLSVTRTLPQGGEVFIPALVVLLLSVGLLVAHGARDMHRRKLEELDLLLRDAEDDTVGLDGLSEALKRLADGDRTVRVGKTQDQFCAIAEQINALAEALEVAEHEQNTFVSTVAHDLRSPMTSIIGFVDAILDGTVRKEEQERYLELVSSECKRLASLVSELLDVSRLRSGSAKIEPEPCDICEIARMTLISFENEIERKRLEVSFEVREHNMAVMADSQALHRVICNLLDNAIKYSPDGARLEIKVQRIDDNIKVEIFNVGRGVREDELGKILEPFYRTEDGRACFKGGSGLGMYICRMILRAHGSDLAVESLYGEWFRASFTLPCARS